MYACILSQYVQFDSIWHFPQLAEECYNHSLADVQCIFIQRWSSACLKKLVLKWTVFIAGDTEFCCNFVPLAGVGEVTFLVLVKNPKKVTLFWLYWKYERNNPSHRIFVKFLWDFGWRALMDFYKPTIFRSGDTTLGHFSTSTQINIHGFDKPTYIR